MKNIEELEKYLEDECYSFAGINIGKHDAREGIVIEKSGDAYEFGYFERGNKRIIKSFSSKQKLAEYALEKLQADKWNKAHLVAWVWSETEIQQAEEELKNYNISFERNDVLNYLQGKNAYCEKIADFRALVSCWFCLSQHTGAESDSPQKSVRAAAGWRKVYEVELIERKCLWDFGFIC